MSFKNLNEEVIADGYQTATATLTSDISDITFMDCISYQATLTGTANGTFTIQVSNTYDAVKDTGTFVNTAVTLAQTSGAFSGGATSGMLVLGEWKLPYKYCRLSYTNTSGDGYCSAVFNGKGI